MITKESITLDIPTAEAMEMAGASLAETLYSTPLTITLSGPIGAGKTTFLKSFAKALGVTDTVTSPTFALEQRYRTTHVGELHHCDLYRLTEEQARELLKSVEHHEGILCVEWPERAGTALKADIALTFEELPQGRRLTCVFSDSPLPSSTDITEWRKDVQLPEHIVRHCNAVAACAIDTATVLAHDHYRIIRFEALRSAALLHDLLRFVDFDRHATAGPAGMEYTSEQMATWNTWKTRYPGQKHEVAIAAFLREQGFPLVAEIVSTHGLTLPPATLRTIEQKLLFYSDKRLIIDRRVSLDERFADFRARYGNGKPSAESELWYEQAKALGHELRIDN